MASAQTAPSAKASSTSTSALGRLWQALPSRRRTAGASPEDEVQEEDRWDLETARAAAVREVAALLAKPDNLGSVGKIKAEYESKRSAVQVHAGCALAAATHNQPQAYARARPPGRLIVCRVCALEICRCRFRCSRGARQRRRAQGSTYWHGAARTSSR